jgi:ribulose-phosphate 3-epimerase
MEKETLIRPSLLSADFAALGKDISEMIDLGIESCHFDVMDGSFVSDISFGEPIFKALQVAYGDRIRFDVHLMTVDPLRQARAFASLGAREISLHYETLPHISLEAIKAFQEEFPQVSLGLAFSPETDVSRVLGLASLFRFFLVMSVVPGKGGQSFIEGSEKKIQRLCEMRATNHLSFQIGVDGGINETTGPLCVKAGADFLVMGSAYFGASSRKEALALLHKNLEV